MKVSAYQQARLDAICQPYIECIDNAPESAVSVYNSHGKQFTKNSKPLIAENVVTGQRVGFCSQSLCCKKLEISKSNMKYAIKNNSLIRMEWRLSYKSEEEN